MLQNTKNPIIASFWNLTKLIFYYSNNDQHTTVKMKNNVFKKKSNKKLSDYIILKNKVGHV